MFYLCYFSRKRSHGREKFRSHGKLFEEGKPLKDGRNHCQVVLSEFSLVFYIYREFFAKEASETYLRKINRRNHRKGYEERDLGLNLMVCCWIFLSTECFLQKKTWKSIGGRTIFKTWKDSWKGTCRRKKDMQISSKRPNWPTTIGKLNLKIDD